MKKIILACIATMAVLTLSADVDFGVWVDTPGKITRSSIHGVRSVCQ